MFSNNQFPIKEMASLNERKTKILFYKITSLKYARILENLMKQMDGI